MSVKTKVFDGSARFDSTTGVWEAERPEIQDLLNDTTQIRTDGRGYSPLPWDPAGVEHVREILADYGGAIVEIEPIDEAESVPGRIY